MKLPSFEETRLISTYIVDGVVYNASPIRENSLKLRKADFGHDNEGIYAEGTYGDQFNLLRGARLNPERPGAKEVIDVFEDNSVSGDTAVYAGDEDSGLIFAQDHPLISRGRIVMNQKRLESCLGSGSRQVGEVIFGSHGVRAMPRAKIRGGKYNSKQIEKAGYVILLTGREQAPEEIAQVSSKTRKSVFLTVPPIRQIRVPILSTEGGRWYLGGYWVAVSGDKYSFGVRQ